MNVSVNHKTPTIHFDNIAAIIFFKKTINLICQSRGKRLQLPQCQSRTNRIIESFIYVNDV